MLAGPGFIESEVNGERVRLMTRRQVYSRWTETLGDIKEVIRGTAVGWLSSS